MTEFRLLITGSRDWLDRQRINGALDAILAQCQMQPRKTLVVVHGDAPRGADAIARRWASVKLGATAADVREERHPADWGTHGKRAGMVRNAEMVSAGADLCLAYIAPCRSPKCDGKPAHGSHGASHCADLAAKAGIDVRRFGFNG
ncbi:MAG TPA: SLOG family protein [Trebonia sp.]